MIKSKGTIQNSTMMITALTAADVRLHLSDMLLTDLNHRSADSCSLNVVRRVKAFMSDAARRNPDTGFCLVRSIDYSPNKYDVYCTFIIFTCLFCLFAHTKYWIFFSCAFVCFVKDMVASCSIY